MRICMPVRRKLLLFTGVLLSALGGLLVGCSSDSPTVLTNVHEDISTNEPVTSGEPHDNIVLRDRLGNAIAPDASEPYSPRQTCGGTDCHNIDSIANAYHFQQGRTDQTGTLLVSDAFDDERPWIRSAGMYGKW
jgi:hypothetical protein